MPTDIARAVAEAYRWQRRLGHAQVQAAHCHIVRDPAHPDVWDANHADAVTAETEDEIAGVFEAMDIHLAHADWRVVHSDGFTPDAFLARLALEGFEERPTTIQMVLRGGLTDRGCAVDLRPVETDGDWAALARLALIDHSEGRKTSDMALTPEVTAGLVAGYRAKSPDFLYHLVIQDGAPVAYGALGAAPNGMGMIEDLFTLPSARRQGVATGMIASFADRLLATGCRAVFLGALAGETPRRLYHRLGFQPVGLARAWVKDLGAQT